MPAAMRLIGPSDHRVMPWKNGHGTTTEIAIDPPDAGLGGGFRWRLSIAAVRRSGPFSAFPGYDRTIMVVEGAGMDLAIGRAPVRRLDRLFEPFAFSGDDPAECRLLGGPIRDFNLMVDRSRLRSRLSVFELDPARPVDLPAADHLIVHCFEGAVELTGGRLDDAGPLAANHTAVLEFPEAGHGARAVAESTARAVVAVVELTPHRPPA
jgi:uncharacterized protein